MKKQAGQPKKKAAKSKPVPAKADDLVQHQDRVSTRNAEPEETSKEQQVTPRPGGKRMGWDSWIICGATVVIAVATVCYTLFSRSQLSVLTGQLRQMQQDSQSNSGAWQKQLDIMQGQLNEMQQTSESDSDAWQTQLDIMQGQLTHLKERAQLEQRAWLGLTGGECQRPLAAREKVDINLHYINTGKTPANGVVVNCAMEFYAAKRDSDTLSFGKRGSKNDIAPHKTAPPNITMTATHSTVLEDFTDEIVQGIADGRMILYVFGEITYDDIFGESHLTEYCFVVDPSTWQLVQYKTYNRMQ